jgi:hypothetical protein
VIASVHVADVGARTAVFARAPKPGKVPGLRSANVGTCAPFSPKLVKKVQPGRLGLVAFWDDDAALDGFLADHPLARAMNDGWRLRLAPLRAFGAWPGLPEDTPKGRKTDHAGITAVVTLAKTRLLRLPKFLPTSAKAEGALLEAPGRIWSTALAKPPFLATCSMWESVDALSEYAYGAANPAHAEAMKVNHAKPFHHEQAFIRFRPYDSVGHLDGKNPLPDGWLT